MQTRKMLVLLALTFPAWGQTPAETRLGQLKAKGMQAEITVFPVRIGNRAMPEAGEVLAVALERGGMQKMDATTQVFTPSKEAEAPDTSVQFGNYIRKAATATGYSLYAECPAGPGASEIRGILVDSLGEPVWSYRPVPGDAAPREPMECIVKLANALREPLGLGDPFGRGGYEGRLAKRMAERTGLPTESEKAAMQKSVTEAGTRLAKSNVLVFPVLIGGKPDSRQAAHLAETLTRADFGMVTVAAAQTGITPQTVPNEQQRLWQMARAFRRYLRQTPAAADYAVLADYVFAPDGRVWTVHFVLAERNGEWAIVDFQNDHQPDFRAMELKSADDCDGLVARRLGRLLREK